MNPTVARGGRSFKGAFLYYMHDKNAMTRERVAWTHGVNMLTDDPDKAWKVMAYTARNHERLKEASGQRAGGRKLEKPVLSYSLSWHPKEKPSAEHMRETALASLKALGLEEHEAMIVAHGDTPHSHVHVVVNRVHPTTGKAASDSFTYRKLSEFAFEYGEAYGLSYSPQRAENRKKRAKGEKVAYQEAKIAEAWAVSDDGRSLIAALEARGFTLAQGKGRRVVVDIYGKIHNPVRHIEGIKKKDFEDGLKDVPLDALPNAEFVARQNAARHEARKSELKAKKAEPARDAAPQGRDSSAVVAPSQFTPDPTQPKQGGDPDREQATAPGAATSHDTTSAKVEHEATRLNALQSRQLQDRADLSDHFHRRLMQTREELGRYYRLDELAAELDQLRKKCENPPWWRRLLGFARRDRSALGILALNFADAKGRFDERIHAIAHDREKAADALRLRHQREWESAIRPERRERAQDFQREDASTKRRSLDRYNSGSEGRTFEYER